MWGRNTFTPGTIFPVVALQGRNLITLNARYVKYDNLVKTR